MQNSLADRKASQKVIHSDDDEWFDDKNKSSLKKKVASAISISEFVNQILKCDSRSIDELVE